jgi:hypothetical protein
MISRLAVGEAGPPRPFFSSRRAMTKVNGPKTHLFDGFGRRAGRRRLRILLILSTSSRGLNGLAR